MRRRRPGFESGEAGAEAAKLKKFSDTGGSRRQWLSDAVRNQVLKVFEYMGSGFSKMKKQARLMQDQFSQMKDKLENTLVEGSAGNGLVTVTLNGSKDLKKITIRPECVTDIEGLQDLILGAFEDASSKIPNQGSPGPMPWM